MTSLQNKPHQKHAGIAKPQLGEFHRHELGIIGTTCANIQHLVKSIIEIASAHLTIAYVDADHKMVLPEGGSVLAGGAAVEFTDQITARKLVYKKEFNSFFNRALFNELDLVLINGNHFKAQSQIVVIDEVKPLNKKLDRLTDVKLVLFAGENKELPDYLLDAKPELAQLPVCHLNDVTAIAAFVQRYVANRIPPVYGLVLAGGKSTRMQQNKGNINYYGKSQRLHTYGLLNNLSTATYISYADEQSVNQTEQLPYIVDKFLGLGPLGGILSAFQQHPDAAWLTVACDLPYLSAETLHYLVQHRNPSKVATAFLDPEGKFPEPLITIWEPRAYQVLLQFLSQGYDCPRKALINSDIQLLQAPKTQDLYNVNYPEERDEAIEKLMYKDIAV